MISRLDKRTFFSALFGASFGITLALSSHYILKYIWKLYFDTTETQVKLRSLLDQVSVLKNEIYELKDELHGHYIENIKQQFNDVPPFFISDDDDDDLFYDVCDEVDSLLEENLSGELVKQTSGFISNVNSYHSALSQLGKIRLGPVVPKEVLTDLDTIANYALGDWSDDTCPPNMTGNEYNPAIQAYSRCLVYKSKYRRSPEFLWRLARAIYLCETTLSDQTIVNIPKDDEEISSDSTSNASPSVSILNDVASKFKNRAQFVYSGLKVARRAIYFVNHYSSHLTHLVNDNVQLAQLYKWQAVMVGLASGYATAQQRITYGFEFKELVDKAINLDSSDAFLYYLQGRWCYEVYNLSWIERQLASRLIATPPTATIEEAERAFQKAEQLRPNHFAAVYYYLAQCCINQLDYDGASKNATLAKNLLDLKRYPSPHPDIAIREDAEELYAKYVS